MKSTAPSLAECYRIIGVPQGSTLDEIKHAYRTKAFALHPDLNPSDGASRQFQQLNEAYVILIRLLDSRAGARPKAGEGKPQDERASRKGRDVYAEQAAKKKEQQERERKEKERREWREAERQAREREAQKEKERREAERREWLRREIERQEAERQARQEQAKQEKLRQQEARKAAEREREERLRQASEQGRPETYRRNYSYTRTGAATVTDVPEGGENAQASAQVSGDTERMAFNTTFAARENGEGAEQGAKRETLLQDLLNDPFARRVYEDIYNEIQQRKNTPAEPPKPKKLSMEWGDKSFQLDLTGGLGGTIKGWMRRQIDEEQELYFPASYLLPGARLRLQIRQGLSRELRTLEITLPHDFAVGKPVRLKGMGKKIGRWQGDLYLTFRIKK